MEHPGVRALAAASLVRRHGVTYADAIRRLEVQSAAHEIADGIDALLGDCNGGMWFDHADGGRLKIGVVRRAETMSDAAIDDVMALLEAHGLSGHADLVTSNSASRS